MAMDSHPACLDNLLEEFMFIKVKFLPTEKFTLTYECSALKAHFLNQIMLQKPKHHYSK